MIKRESNFDKNIDVIKIGEDISITLRAFPNVKNFPCEVSISGFGKEKRFQRLAWIESIIIGRKRVKFIPKLYYVIQQTDEMFLAVIGLFDIIFVNPLNKSIAEIVQLNRSETDDQGFYKMNILLLENSFILIYEGGVIKINNGGMVLWHTLLMWDDIFLRCDEKFLYYSSEFGEFAPDEWKISIQGGEIFQI